MKPKTVYGIVMNTNCVFIREIMEGVELRHVVGHVRDVHFNH